MLGCSWIHQKLKKTHIFSLVHPRIPPHQFTEPARLRVILHQRGDRSRRGLRSSSWRQTRRWWWCDSFRAAARTAVSRFDRFLLIHSGNSVLVSTVFLLVSPLSTVTTVALKLGTALVFTLVLSFALVLAFLALSMFLPYLPLSPYTASFSIGDLPLALNGLGCHDGLATE